MAKTRAKTKGGKQRKVKKVMDEWKSGKLRSGSGDKVKSQKQAVAIALSESGQSRKSKRGGAKKRLAGATF